MGNRVRQCRGGSVPAADAVATEEAAGRSQSSRAAALQVLLQDKDAGETVQALTRTEKDTLSATEKNLLASAGFHDCEYLSDAEQLRDALHGAKVRVQAVYFIDPVYVLEYGMPTEPPPEEWELAEVQAWYRDKATDEIIYVGPNMEILIDPFQGLLAGL